MKTLVTTIATTVVSKEVIYADGKLLAEMTDGSLLQFNLYRRPDQKELDGFAFRGAAYGWRYLTKEQLVEKVGDINRNHMADCNHALHLDKVRRLGQDYRARGYY